MAHYFDKKLMGFAVDLSEGRVRLADSLPKPEPLKAVLAEQVVVPKPVGQTGLDESMFGWLFGSKKKPEGKTETVPVSPVARQQDSLASRLAAKSSSTEQPKPKHSRWHAAEYERARVAHARATGLGRPIGGGPGAAGQADKAAREADRHRSAMTHHANILKARGHKYDGKRWIVDDVAIDGDPVNEILGLFGAITDNSAKRKQYRHDLAKRRAAAMPAAAVETPAPAAASNADSLSKRLKDRVFAPGTHVPDIHHGHYKTAINKHRMAMANAKLHRQRGNHRGADAADMSAIEHKAEAENQLAKLGKLGFTVKDGKLVPVDKK